MPVRDDLHGDDVFLIRDFLTPGECLHHIAATEAAGYEDAPINSGGGRMVMRKDVRNNDRVILDDHGLAADLFGRAAPFLPARWFGWQLAGLNERFRFYRYTPGQKFDWHMDGAFVRDTGEASQLTLLVYLNAGCRGGETLINLRRSGMVRVDDRLLTVVPEEGTALVFRHDVLHTGALVTAGTKYVLRSDVMYRRAE